jgi:hypothetical protein
MSVQRFISLISGKLAEIVPNQTSAGAGDSGKLVALNSAGDVDVTMMPPGIGANTFTGIASAAISAGMLVNIYNNAGTMNIRPADSTAVGSMAHGYATAAITSGATGTVNLGAGAINGLSGLTIGSDYYLGAVGAVVTTPPATAGNVVQYVGIATSVTELDFQPSQSPVTVA